MKLNEAIKHCKEKAEELREQPFKEKMDIEDIAEWLTELQDIRKVVKDWQDGKIDDDMPMLKAFSRIIKIIEKSEDK